MASQSTNAWNEIFKQEGKVFAEPHEDMAGIAQLLKGKGANTILDLGCGSGRHVIYLAQNGFTVSGLDNSPEGIAMTRQWLADEGLPADLRLQNMMERLPYQDAFFDAVISVQVIHHARLATIRNIVQEIGRILKKEGFIFITTPTLKHEGETFEEIEPRTFIPLDGWEKGLPHHYFTPEELRVVFADFEVIDIHLDATSHYCLSAFKRGI